MRFAVINTETSIVENVILWDEETEWPVPEGYFLVKTDIGNIEDTYDQETGTFTPKPQDEVVI